MIGRTDSGILRYTRGPVEHTTKNQKYKNGICTPQRESFQPTTGFGERHGGAGVISYLFSGFNIYTVRPFGKIFYERITGHRLGSCYAGCHKRTVLDPKPFWV